MGEGVFVKMGGFGGCEQEKVSLMVMKSEVPAKLKTAVMSWRPLKSRGKQLKKTELLSVVMVVHCWQAWKVELQMMRPPELNGH